MGKRFLNIDNCIIFHDLKQIKKEPPESKIKTKNKLAKKMFDLGLFEGTKISIYTRLSRYEKEGYYNEPTSFIEAILKILEVKKTELVKNK